MIDNEVIEFINKIIKKSKSKEDLIKNLETYRNYLVLTEIYEEEVLCFIEKLSNEADKIFAMKDSFGKFDIKGLIDDEELIKENKPKTKIKEKHYNHYVKDESDYSYGCSSTPSYSNSCSPSIISYGSSCGGSTPIYRGC